MTQRHEREEHECVCWKTLKLLFCLGSRRNGTNWPCSHCRCRRLLDLCGVPIVLDFLLPRISLAIFVLLPCLK
jgi:hypothetical protein